MMLRAAVVLASAAVLAACTGGGAAEPDRPPTASPTASVAARPGTYRYEFNGVTATFRLHGSAGSIEIRNGTGTPLGAPRLSILAAGDGARFTARVEGAGPLGGGDQTSYEVILARPVHPRDVGLVVLSFGADVWGALSPAGG